MFFLRESNPTCLFDCLNTFCPVGTAPREDNANDIWPSLLSKRKEENINGTVGSFQQDRDSLNAVRDWLLSGSCWV